MVARLIPSMSMDQVPRTVGKVGALLSTPMSPFDVARLGVSTDCSCIAPPCDASSRNSRTWLLACWEGSILAATVVEVVEVVGLVVVQAPSVAAARIPLLLLLHLFLLQLVGLLLALPARRGKPPCDDEAGGCCSTRLL